MAGGEKKLAAAARGVGTLSSKGGGVVGRLLAAAQNAACEHAADVSGKIS